VTDDSLPDRVFELRQWMNSRITACRQQELKFGRHIGKHPAQSLVEAWTERRALQAVQGILGLPPTPELDPKPTVEGE
jgi:hypothetical protein